MTSFEEILAAYDYDLPPELIATAPVSPRDSARLLIYRKEDQSIMFDVFRNIAKYLPKNSVLVLNNTKVFPARMTLKKSSGGTISALYLHDDGSTLTVMATGTLRATEMLSWEDGHTFTIVERNGKEAVLQPSFPVKDLPTLLERYGHTPLPPYIKESPLTESERRHEYQTIYAADRGSIAAPTAGLHFTESLLQELRSAGIDLEYITLHVHLGTFAPLEAHQWTEKKLHKERYSISDITAERLNVAKTMGKPIVSVGTTTVRALESATSSKSPYTLHPTPYSSTDLFITEHTPLRFVDHMITNFHLPRSSLLMLVAAFTGRERLMGLYKRAIDERMRFYSFGDAMLVP